MQVHPRETVILAEDVRALADWYRRVLSLRITRDFSEDYDYINLENDQGLALGIASARQMGVTPGERASNTVLLQVAVADVKAFFALLEQEGGAATFGPSFDEKHGFWYGGFHDPEGNPLWVVDTNCP